jgi:hypothetical protein
LKTTAIRHNSVTLTPPPPKKKHKCSRVNVVQTFVHNSLAGKKHGYISGGVPLSPPKRLLK